MIYYYNITITITITITDEIDILFLSDIYIIKKGIKVRNNF